MPASEPQLEKPGAGLPWAELQIARARFRIAVWRKSPDQFTTMFQTERDLLLQLSKSCDPATGTQRVMIDRIPGLEDSSRHWSAFMTFHHLKIVNAGFAGIIRSLGRGVIPKGTISTADVKPSPKAGIQAITEFERSCTMLLRCAQKASQSPQHKNLTFPHPWFGELNQNHWHALAAIHLQLHRIQLQRILSTI